MIIKYKYDKKDFTCNELIYINNNKNFFIKWLFFYYNTSMLIIEVLDEIYKVLFLTFKKYYYINLNNLR